MGCWRPAAPYSRQVPSTQTPAPAAGEHVHPHGEAPLAMVGALTFTAAGTVVLFFYPVLPLTLAEHMMTGPP